MGCFSEKETLAKILKRKVLRVSISAGSKPGDNYVSVMKAFEVVAEKSEDGSGDEEVIHLVAKCYPANDVRRDYNNQINIFYKECAAYQHLIPKLQEFSIEYGHEKLFRNMFAPFIAGQTVDFSSFDAKGLENISQKPFDELDQFILMTDIRKTWNYKMVDRQESMNVEYFSLVIDAIAKLHSLSWSYKVKRGIEFKSEFPFLAFEMRATVRKVWEDMLENGLQTALDVFDSHLGKESNISKGTRNLKSTMVDIFTTYVTAGGDVEACKERLQRLDTLLRIPPEKIENEDSWSVILHGDCWANNFLFLYDEATQKPTDVVMVDLQLIREFCPTADLCYLIYTSTDGNFREAHMETMLKLYVEKCTQYCELFGVEPLPGFSYTELKRRVHRGKLFGFIIAIFLLPGFLKDAEEADDLDKVDEVEMGSMFTSGKNDGNYIKRILEIGEEMYADGII